MLINNLYVSSTRNLSEQPSSSNNKTKKITKKNNEHSNNNPSNQHSFYETISFFSYFESMIGTIFLINQTIIFLLICRLSIFRDAAVANPGILFFDVGGGMVVTTIVFLCGIPIRTTPDAESTCSIWSFIGS